MAQTTREITSVAASNVAALLGPALYDAHAMLWAPAREIISQRIADLENWGNDVFRGISKRFTACASPYRPDARKAFAGVDLEAAKREMEAAGQRYSQRLAFMHMWSLLDDHPWRNRDAALIPYDRVEEERKIFLAYLYTPSPDQLTLFSDATDIVRAQLERVYVIDGDDV